MLFASAVAVPFKGRPLATATPEVSEMNGSQLERQRQQVTELARSWWSGHGDPAMFSVAGKEVPATAQVPPVVPIVDPEADVDDWRGEVAPALDRHGRPTRSNQGSPGRSNPRYS
jgi:hypothetical protein